MDANGRIKENLLTLNGEKIAGEYYYFRKHGDHGTNQISSVRYGEIKNGDYVIKDGVSYTYDACGNITEVKENGKLSSRYGYDRLNRLIREDNAKFCKTTLFTYDNNGNILTKKEAPFRLCETEKITEFMDEKEYTYDAKSPDRLLAFGNEEILGYDSIGNPNSYRGKNFTWQKGRQLASVTDSVETLYFSYDAMGRRMGKRADGESTKYVYVGDMLIREERCDENNILYFGDNLITGDNFIDGDEIVIDSVNKSVLEYFYGQDGVMGLVYNGEKYWFRRNIQGDISRIFALDGTLKACYAYDAWGNHIVFDADGNINTDPDFIGNINPYRYRGYYFDTETGLFWVQSRYYDPEVGRFISPDSIEYLDPETLGGLNLYAYCLNNPISYIDPDGHAPKWWQWLIAGIGVALIATAAVLAIVGTGGVAAFGIGALIGSASVGLGGAVVGGAIGYAVGGVDGMWQGALMGFGIGAAVGFAIGGAVGLSSYGASLGTSFGKIGTVVKHPGLKVDWSKNILHGADRMLQRGVTKRLVNSTVRKGITLSQAGGKFAFVTKKAFAVISSTGALVTTYGKAFYDAGMLEIIKKLFGG